MVTSVNVLLQIGPAIGVADKMDGIAFVAFFQGVQGKEMIPVFALFGGQLPGAVAQGAVVLESRQNSLADEFGFIGNPVQLSGELFVGLEGEDAFP
jgi:hypothetical protein